MGACCGRSMNSGEERIRLAIVDTEFLLSLFTYDKLLETLNKNAVDGKISKEKFQELLPLFFTHDKERNRYFNYHKKLFDHLSQCISIHASVYEVLFFLYPYISHHEEAVTDKFYDIVYNLNNKVLQYSRFRASMKRYVEEVTVHLTSIFYRETEEGPVKDDLAKLSQNVFNNDNVNKELKYYVDGVIKDPSDTKLVGPVELHNHLKERRFTNWQDIRNRFLDEYQH
jgi:hypothetical protein